MKKILFIIGAYYPNYSANGLCCKNVIDECVKRGYDVYCIANATKLKSKFYVHDGVEIFPVKPKLITIVYNWTLENKNSRIRKILYKVLTYFNKVKLLLMSRIWPLTSYSYSNRFYKKAKMICNKKHIDVVITAYTPFEALYAGYKLKKKYSNLTFIPYYLDALYGGWGPSIWSKEKINKHTNYWENKIDSIADLIISMESVKSFHCFNNDFFNNKRYYLDVPTLKKYDYDICKTKKNDKYTFVFAGAIQYPRRNPIPILNLFLELSKQIDIEVEFIGNCNNQKIFDYYTSESNNSIKLVGEISHDEILNKELNADFLINIGSGNANTIPCKIFEYMIFHKPIISTYSIDNEPSIEYLKKYGNVFFIDERKKIEEYKEPLKAFIINAANNSNDGNIYDIFYKNTPGAFVDLIMEKLEK